MDHERVNKDLGRVGVWRQSRHFEKTVKHNLVPRVLSLPTSRKYPGCGWSRVYVYKSNPHREWVFDLIVSRMSMEEKFALPQERYFESKAS